MAPCDLDVVVARHEENITWVRDLGRSSRICDVHVYRTSYDVEAHEVAVPNTGREALCFIWHILRMLSGQVQTQASVVAFVQGSPHCSWDSSGHPACTHEFADALFALSEHIVDRRGGIVLLGSVAPREFGIGEDLPEQRPSAVAIPRQIEPGSSQLNACYRYAFTNLSGLSVGEAMTLYSAIKARGVFMPGAQFALTRSALQSVSPTLYRWLSRAAQLMQAPGLEDSSAPGYDDHSCCASASRTCLPWLLERLWLPFFQLARLVRDPDFFDARSAAFRWSAGPSAPAQRRSLSSPLRVSPGKEGDVKENWERAWTPAWSYSAVWHRPTVLAHLLLSNRTSRRELRMSGQMPPALRYIERQYAALASAADAAGAALFEMPHARLAELGRLLSPLHFEVVAEPDLYRSTTPAAAMLRRIVDLHSPHPRMASEGGGSSKRNSRGMDTIQLVELKRRLQRLQAASLAAHKWAHSMGALGKKDLLRLSNPRFDSDDGILATSRTADFHLAQKQGRALPRALPLPSLNPEAGDWAEMICQTLKRQAVTAEAAQDACASIGGWNASV